MRGRGPPFGGKFSIAKETFFMLIDHLGRGGMQPGYMPPQFNSYGPSTMMAPPPFSGPPRDYPGPIIRGKFRQSLRYLIKHI